MSSINNTSQLYYPPFFIPLLQYLFEVVWFFLCAWTPKPFNPLRLLVLKIFGCKIHGIPFIHPRARITHPWNTTFHHRATLGDRAHAYALGKVELNAHCTVAQEAYLCTGSHNLKDASLPLITKPIVVGPHAFIGARAFVLPGVNIASHAIVGACSVVTKDVSASTTVAGNPAKVLSSQFSGQ